MGEKSRYYRAMLELIDIDAESHSGRSLADFERAIALEVKRRATACGLTSAALAAQAGIDRRTYERWVSCETTLGMRKYLALLRVVRHAEKMQHRAAQKSAQSGIK
jgi:hypothetical protein